VSTTIHHEVVFKASPERIYQALTDSKIFTEFTGEDMAQISREAGGTISLFGGYVIGRNIELVPNQRIVQAWRAKNWDDGVYSIVKFELKGQRSETRIIFDHSGFPEGNREHLDQGWHKMYWEPLRKYLSQS